jgi:hypothetical protein
MHRHTQLSGLAAAIALIGLVMSLSASLAHATGSFRNALIAEYALQHNNGYGGQCIVFARDMVRAASGGSVIIPGTMARNGGYYQSYIAAGATRESVTTAAEGDIIQLYNPMDQKHYYRGMHTAIVLENKGGGTFKVIDSNFVRKYMVGVHLWNVPVAAARYHLMYAVWRFGSADEIPTKTPTPARPATPTTPPPAPAAAPPPQAATTPTVRGTVQVASGQTLHIRSGPGTGFPVIGSLANGTTIAITCQTLGGSVVGMWGPTTLWDHLDSGGYASDGFIYTGTNGQVAPNC